MLGATQLVAGTLGGTGVGFVDLTQQAGKWQASEVWNSSAMKPEFPDLVTYQGHAYGFDGEIFCCLNLESGERRWKKGRYGHGQVVLLEEQGVLLVISEQGEELSWRPIPSNTASWASSRRCRAKPGTSGRCARAALSAERGRTGMLRFAGVRRRCPDFAVALNAIPKRANAFDAGLVENSPKSAGNPLASRAAVVF